MTPLGPATLHLCIDMQRLFSTEGPWPTPWMERVLPVVAEIAERAPDRTVFTRFIPPYRPEDMPGTWRGYYERWACHIAGSDRNGICQMSLAMPLHPQFRARWRTPRLGGAGAFGRS
jgi:nicotinamidase-related amidase